MRPTLIQTPAPGAHRIAHDGDLVRFALTLPEPASGRAWLRTNIGRAAVHRAEIIQQIENGEPLLGNDWHDIEMLPESDERTFTLELPLLEVGRFEAKAFFVPGPVSKSAPVWPEGKNTVFKVEPSAHYSGLSVYCAFVRQFGQNKTTGAVSDKDSAAIARLEKNGYAVIPRSGTFRDLTEELDTIINTMGFRAVQLLPIFPTPTTYARMGHFGSPFASLDFMDVDPALAEFDRETTPLDQFGELVDEIHRRRARVFLDLPINHTGWASWLQNHHPEWFQRDEEDEFVSPGAWGVTWADLSKLDYSQRALWVYMAEVFLFWCRRGVDGFRCDAGHMIPIDVWRYIIAKVRREFPDTTFLLEGLGGGRETVHALLDQANLNMDYSELFQNHNRTEVESILRETIGVASTIGGQIHFAETHDNLRLASVSKIWARMRTALAALTSHGGGFGITAGVEWFATERVEVHGAASLGWGNPENQIDVVRRLNAILQTHPAFFYDARLTMVTEGDTNALALHRQPSNRHPDAGDLLILVNLDPENTTAVEWRADAFPGKRACDLLTGDSLELAKIRWKLAPGEARCLAHDESWLKKVQQRENSGASEPEAVLNQRAASWSGGLSPAMSGSDGYPYRPDMARELRRDPFAYCALLTKTDKMSRVTRWRWPRDIHRTVLWAPGFVLLMTSEHPFIAQLHMPGRPTQRRWSLPDERGEHFVVFPPNTDCPDHPITAGLETTTLNTSEVLKDTGSLLVLPKQLPDVRMTLNKTGKTGDIYGLCTNGRGAMSLAQANWGEIRSQYDALLAANPHPDFPVDRLIVLTRCRLWLVYRDYSRPVDADSLEHFGQSDSSTLEWSFLVPAGMGKLVRLELALRLWQDANKVSLEVRRGLESGESFLGNEEPVSLISRPDVDHRSFHHKTKAHNGAEETWTKAVSTHPTGFRFAPPGRAALEMTTDCGDFTFEPEWEYMVPHPVDAERGLDGSSDLFSPGFFRWELRGGGTNTIQAQLADETTTGPAPASNGLPERLTLSEAARRAIPAFVVKRDDSKTVIAGYPWFLDWGRDTLICLRGMIAAGMLEETRDVLLQFARFEKNGTLPNMIRGEDDSNRDTSDAPLWYVVVSGELAVVEGNLRFSETDCGGGRTIRDTLLSIVGHYRDGTPNGIRMDPMSGLIYSPSHYTWMDTDHPPGTPRQGYPVEIQALWHASLSLANQLDPGGGWQTLCDQVRASILKLYWDPDRGFLSDCLHAEPEQSAALATPDDHLRSNQLLAVTLNAITDRDIARKVIESSEELLVPGAIRSLADRPVTHELSVKRDGKLLNDPRHPYWGHYSGDEDTRRKPAYHNGTAWTWPFPSYAEALVLVYGDEARDTALSILSSSTFLFESGCLGQLPEIIDGNSPHTQKGCGAQAWSATELYRVLKLVDEPEQEQGAGTG